MSKYFFYIRDDNELGDDQGWELPDLDAVQRTAAEYLGAIMRDAGAMLFGRDDISMDVTDEDGLVLFTAHVCCHRAAAVPVRLAALG